MKVYVNVLGTKREFNADISLIRNKRVAGVLIYSVYDQIDGSGESAFLAVIERRLESAEKKPP